MTDKRRAVCGESRTHGSEGGVGKQACDHVGQPKAPCSYLTMQAAKTPGLAERSYGEFTRSGFQPTGNHAPISRLCLMGW
jgi:hypothetical protein